MSQTVSSKGIYPTATLHRSEPASAGQPRTKARLDVEVDVIDGLVKEAAPEADVFETVKVGLPTMKRGQLEWKEVTLAYNGRGIRGYYARDVVDQHEASLTGVNARALQANGYYVKLEYRGGEAVVWAQGPDQNFKPTVA